MTDIEMIEAAANALGWASWDWLAGDGSLNVYDANGRHALFSPLTNHADSDQMGCDLEIGMRWRKGNVVCWSDEGDGPSFHATHDNTVEDRRAAVRLARLRVAAERGRVK